MTAKTAKPIVRSTSGILTLLKDALADIVLPIGDGVNQGAHIGTYALPEMAKRAAVLGVKPCQADTRRARLAVSTAAVAKGPAKKKQSWRKS